MGWYIRKSKSFGPIRVNLSKSGLGISAGVKGARVSVGPKGTYLNAGRNGLYYRKKLDSSNKRHNSVSGGNQSFLDDDPLYNTSPVYEQDSIITQSDPISENLIGENIVKGISRSRVIFWIWVGISVTAVGVFSYWGLLGAAVLFLALLYFFSARISFELDDEAKEEWSRFLSGLYNLQTSQYLWIVEASSYNSDLKVNAGAGRNIQRGPISALRVAKKGSTRFRLRMDVDSFLLKCSKCYILFMPSGILVKKGLKVFAYTYEQFSIYDSTISFIEHGVVPRDAFIVEQTWQYVNKDGSPDRRYANNRSIPVCRYGVMHISGLNINIELQSSNTDACAGTGASFEQYRDFLRKEEYEKLIQPGMPDQNETKQLEDVEDKPSIREAMRERWKENKRKDQNDSVVDEFGRPEFSAGEPGTIIVEDSPLNNEKPSIEVNNVDGETGEYYEDLFKVSPKLDTKDTDKEPEIDDLFEFYTKD